jgi:hypothetical protein
MAEEERSAASAEIRYGFISLLYIYNKGDNNELKRQKGSQRALIYYGYERLKLVVSSIRA